MVQCSNYVLKNGCWVYFFIMMKKYIPGALSPKQMYTTTLTHCIMTMYLNVIKKAILLITFLSVQVICRRKPRYPFKCWTMAICLWKNPQIFPHCYLIFCTCCIKKIFVGVEITHNKQFTLGN